MKKLLVLLLATASFASNAFAQETIKSLEKKIEDKRSLIDGIHDKVEGDPQVEEWSSGGRMAHQKMNVILYANKELSKIRKQIRSNNVKIGNRWNKLQKSLLNDPRIQKIQKQMDNLREKIRKVRESFNKTQANWGENYFKQTKTDRNKLSKLWRQKQNLMWKILNNDKQIKDLEAKNEVLYVKLETKIEDIKQTNPKLKNLSNLVDRLRKQIMKRFVSLYHGNKPKLDLLYEETNNLYQQLDVLYRKDTTKEQIQAKEKQEEVTQIVKAKTDTTASEELIKKNRRKQLITRY